MSYNNYNDIDKKKIINDLYIKQNLSFKDIDIKFDTYTNKIRRDAKRFNIPIRDKSEAQKNALKTGKHKHPTKGAPRPEDTKAKIGNSVMESWENLTDKQKKIRKQKESHNPALRATEEVIAALKG